MTQRPNRAELNRRAMVFGGGTALALGMAAMAGVPAALADETPKRTTEEKRALREKLAAYPYQWSATSPATHLGDEYTLVVENTGASPVKLWVHAIIMDHRRHHNEVAVEEEIELAGGEQREFVATNGYGTANHFSTRLATDAADTATLALAVALTDAGGEETCRFNQRAFMVVNREEQRRARRDERRDDQDSDHSPHGGKAADNEAEAQ